MMSGFRGSCGTHGSEANLHHASFGKARDPFPYRSTRHERKVDRCGSRTKSGYKDFAVMKADLALWVPIARRLGIKPN
jgi:hypothetical protein